MDTTSLTNSATEQIIGYDARDYRNDYDALWPPKRREEFLYRFDVKKVLSVDVRVWPPIFTALGRPVRSHQTAMQDLWANARSLRESLSEAAQQHVLPAFRTVCFTLVEDGAEGVHPTREQVATLVDPSALSPDWQFVGYDVADAWMLSALTNCGFLPGYDDAGRLRREWAPHLNEFHLFGELVAASAFRRMSDQRLASDHAPAFVYGIHIVK